MWNPGEIVPASGPNTAEIAIVGEAPGEHEVYEGRNFCGPAGWQLDSQLNAAGIARSTCWVDNVMQVRPPGNNFGYFWKDEMQLKPTTALKEGVLGLLSRLSALPNLKVIITLGRQPTYILTGKAKYIKKQGNIKKSSISEWRGSILPINLAHHFECYDAITCSTESNNWNSIKVIPTYHPAYINRVFTLRPLALLDLKRARQEVDIEGLQYRERTYIHNALFVELCTRLSTLQRETYEITIDIETIKNTHIMHRVGFASDSTYAVSVPFIRMETGQNWWSVEEEAALWKLIAEICDNPAPKVLQNGMFDIMWLNSYGINVRNFSFDTKIAQHVLLPGIYPKSKPLGLPTICSVWTRHPYYKDDGAYSRKDLKQSDEENGRYNCTDCAVTHESMEAMSANPLFLKRKKIFDFEMALLARPIHWMMKRGVKVDLKYKKKMREVTKSKMELVSLRAQHAACQEMNVGSPTQVAAYLFDELKIPHGKSRTVNEDTLKILHAKHPNIPFIKHVLEYRKLATQNGRYWKMKVNSDGRVRCDYSPTTTTIRFKSSKNSFGSGTNLQAVERGPIVRKMFIPDEGFTLINADLEQAELRAVAYLANSHKLIKMLETDGVDVHAQMANEIVGSSPQIVDNFTSDEIRQLGKRVVHASNYLMGPRKFVETCRLELGLNLKEAEAKRLLQNYHINHPAIRIWHKQIQAELNKTNGRLKGVLGYDRTFFERPKDMLAQAVAFKPQNFIAHLLNQILLEVFDDLNEPGEFELLMQEHDSMKVQVRTGKEKYWIDKMRPYFDKHTEINGHDVVIPVAFEVGKSWGEMEEWNES
jgi:uracil-DNA glycosylase family 4